MTAPQAFQNNRSSSISAPVIGAHEFSAGELRDAQARRNERGQKMTPSRIAQARAMHASGRYTILQIAEVLGVSRSTVHRHLG